MMIRKIILLMKKIIIIYIFLNIYNLTFAQKCNDYDLLINIENKTIVDSIVIINIHFSNNSNENIFMRKPMQSSPFVYHFEGQWDFIITNQDKNKKDETYLTPGYFDLVQWHDIEKLYHNVKKGECISYKVYFKTDSFMCADEHEEWEGLKAGKYNIQLKCTIF